MEKPTRLEVKEGFIRNLIKVRNDLNFTQSEMAKRLDMKVDAYRKLERGDVDRIDFYTAINVYFMTGQLGYAQSGFQIPYGSMMMQFNELSELQKNYISAMVDFEYQFVKKVHRSEDYITVYVPMGNMEDGMIYDSANVFKFNISKYRELFGDKIKSGLKVTSNHLQPVYNDGDILLISSEPPKHGDICIYIDRDTDKVYIRKYYPETPTRLESITGFGDDILIDYRNEEEARRWLKYGKILTKIR